MGTRLDDLLNESAPAAVVSDRQTAATREFSRSIAGAGGQRGPRRGTVLAGGLLSLALLSGATAAAASPEVRLALGWVPDRTLVRSFEPLDGTAAQACEAFYHLVAEGDPSAAAVERARNFVAGFDADSIEANSELAEELWETYGDKDPSGMLAQINAYGNAVTIAMWDDLKAHGYSDDSYLISFEGNSNCADGATS
jgi:hypothetical protein